MFRIIKHNTGFDPSCDLIMHEAKSVSQLIILIISWRKRKTHVIGSALQTSLYFVFKENPTDSTFKHQSGLCVMKYCI